MLLREPMVDADDEVHATHTRPPVSLGGTLILRLATNVGLIDLDGSKQETVLVMGEGGADAMTQVPGGLLTDTEITRQLGAGHPFSGS